LLHLRFQGRDTLFKGWHHLRSFHRISLCINIQYTLRHFPADLVISL